MIPNKARGDASSGWPKPHALIVLLSAYLIAGVFFTGLLYVSSLNGHLEIFSIWLLTAALIVAGLAELTPLAEA